MKKRITRIVICLVLVLSLMPASAFAFSTGNASWEAAKKDIYTALKEGKSSVDIKKYNISTGNIDTLVQEIRDQYPDLFFADPNRYSYVGNTVYAIQISYNELNTAEAKSAYEQAVNNALLSINSKMTDLEKALALHDYLVKNTIYDPNPTLASHNAYAALVTKKAVCDGYSKAYLELLNRCGIESYIVRSVDMDHVWNQVHIGDYWYNIDVTWDDPTPDRCNIVSYTYFMLSDNAINAKEHYSWTYYYECTDSTYDRTNNWDKIANNLPKSSSIFTDVFDTDFFCSAVLWAYDNNITKGMTDTTFGPSSTCTRGQAMTFLWRAAGKPESSLTSIPFTDVKPGDYFYEAVAWAYENGIANGTSETKFDPYMTCSNAHIVTFLYRAKGCPSTTIDPAYSNTYYAESVSWANNAGLLTKIPGDLIVLANSPRAYIVYFLYLTK